jgi:hypothetical protein
MKKLSFLPLMFAIYCGTIFATEETIIDYTTYQTRVTNRDIAEEFTKNMGTYWGRNSYYLCQYQVYQGKSDQNYSWRFRVIKNTYDWGTVYNLRFDVSNGYFIVKLSNTSFASGVVDASPINIGYGVWHFSHFSVMEEYDSFVRESIMTLKMNNDDYGYESRNALSKFNWPNGSY